MFEGRVLGYAPLPMQPVRLDIEKQPGLNGSQMVMRLKGKLSLETVHNFIQILRPEPAAHLILDFRAVSFLDSALDGRLVQLFVPPTNHLPNFHLTSLTSQSTQTLQLSA